MTYLKEEVQKRSAFLEFLRGTKVIGNEKHVEIHTNQNSFIKILREVGIFKGDFSAKCTFNQIEQALNLFIFRNPSRITMNQLEVILKELKSLIELNTKSKNSDTLSIEDALDWIVYKVCLHTELNKLGSYSKGTSELLLHIQESLLWRCVTLDFNFSDLRNSLNEYKEYECLELLFIYFKKTFVALSPEAPMRMKNAAIFDFKNKAKDLSFRGKMTKKLNSVKRISVIPETFGEFFNDFFINFYLYEAEFTLLNFLLYCTTICPDEKEQVYKVDCEFLNHYLCLEEENIIESQRDSMILPSRRDSRKPSLLALNLRDQTLRENTNMNDSVSSSNSSMLEEIEKGNFMSAIFMLDTSNRQHIIRNNIEKEKKVREAREYVEKFEKARTEHTHAENKTEESYVPFNERKQMDIFNTKNIVVQEKMGDFENNAEVENYTSTSAKLSNILANGRVVIKEKQLEDKRVVPITLDKASKEKLKKIPNQRMFFTPSMRDLSFGTEDNLKSGVNTIRNFDFKQNQESESFGSRIMGRFSKFGTSGAKSDEKRVSFKVDEVKKPQKKTFFGFFNCCFR